ncbi:hypothetical protein IWQ47_001595 [Aquimarina sp. EL_43]|uniref:hypothetical protein n=1 Tax=Aquimarina TaxID=290174 RepID=UPI00047067AA|nr:MULTISPECIES: hypothetical protein [Aquimarina]MBG6130322.1 hypothetical protein [Aquimarina sp. EL_35]MBG6149102.1 hypothetical protein [Aquimarina sp. EL_32]MBG6168524.1 hypothetical protein [Aquimarina sp. EL_43]
MKKRNTNKQVEIAEQGSVCCGSTTVQAQSAQSSCCEQPTDGSSCCDKEESKEINIEKTGCC